MPEPTAADDCPGRVLAVDDCALTREIVCAALRERGYNVQAVDSGWAALAAADGDAFDAFVLDVQMPGLDGPALARALRRNPRTAGAMIAMHSGVAEDALRGEFADYDAFVPKSQGPRVLGERVDGLLRRRRAGSPGTPGSPGTAATLPGAAPGA